MTDKDRGDGIDWDALFDVAATIRERAHAPYSNFKVGAALLTEDGVIHPGCNVENATYGLTVCAERNAFMRAVMEGGSRPIALAVLVDAPDACPPCGLCRQTAAEFVGGDLRVQARNLGGKRVTHRLDQLFPFPFSPDQLP